MNAQHLTLQDGRVLAYAELGAATGVPIFYCHGAPSSRVETRLTVGDATATELGLRIIVPDRPGMGESDFLAAWRIADWPKDLVELANALHIDTFGVIGSSAGAPYALACGRFIPTRVRVVGVVGGVAPIDAPRLGKKEGRVGGGLARKAPALLRTLIRLQLWALRSEKVRGMMADVFPEPDKTLFHDRDIREAFIACFEEACRRGLRGVVWEKKLLHEPWGFDLADIEIPVRLWQGERDGNVSASQARYLAAAMAPPARSGCEAIFYPDDAHLSVWRNHHREILGEMKRLTMGSVAV